MDDDDRPGYLIDFINSWWDEHMWLRDEGEEDIELDFDEQFQSDTWSETVIEFAEEVLKIAGKIPE
jgi:hypothetical protein